VSGLVATLVGGGLIWLWPEHRWIGAAMIIAGVLIAMFSIVWALSHYVALREVKALPLPSQSLTQHAPITNTNNPVFAPRFEFNPQLSQRTTYSAPTQYRTAPHFDCKEMRIEHRVVNVNTGRLLNEPYFGKPEDLDEYLRMAQVVFARFYYSVNPDAEPSVSVNAHVSFYTAENEGESTLQKTIFDAVWYDGEEKPSKHFYQAKAHDLIVALVPLTENPTGVIGYEYATQKLEGYWGSDTYPTPKHHLIPGSEFLVKVELIAKRGDEVKADQTFQIALKITPKVTATEVRPFSEL